MNVYEWAEHERPSEIAIDLDDSTPATLDNVIECHGRVKKNYAAIAARIAGGVKIVFGCGKRATPMAKRLVT